MKKFVTLVVLAVIFSLNGFANPVSVAKAKQVGQTFLTTSAATSSEMLGAKLNVNYQLIFTATAVNSTLNSTESETVLFYVFGAEDNGFVIVAGDDCIVPILGYSHDGTLYPNNIPPNMQGWLEGYKAEIRYAIENNISATEEIQAQWAALEAGNPISTSKDVQAIAPMITTKWDQSAPYNSLCPQGSNGARPPTGCVATAMAQVMMYWKHPTTGTGSSSYTPPGSYGYGLCSADFGNTTYDWQNMPNKLTTSSSAAQKTAVATLMYHCGVSVKMQYGPQGSGAMMEGSAPSAVHALKTYFGYKSTLSVRYKQQSTEANWKNLIKTELDAGRPLLYAATSTAAGHAFVCDGYDANDKFHFNWGWSGSGDGYFLLNALATTPYPGGPTYDFSSGQRAVIGLEPSNGTGVPPDNYEVNDAQAQSYQLPVSFSNNNANPKTTGSNFHNSSDIDYYKIVLSSGYNYTVKPRLHDAANSGNGQTYTVNAQFSYSTNGTSYSGNIDDVMTGNIAVNNGGTVYFKVAPSTSGSIGTYLLDIPIERVQMTGIDNIELNNQISLYPNPAKEFVTVDLKDFTETVSKIVLLDMQGREIYTENETAFKQTVNLPLNNISEGIYFVQIYSGKGILTKKLIVE